MQEAKGSGYGELAGAMGVLASPLRLQLLHRLARAAFVPDLADEFGITRQALKKHLDAMEAAGLVVARPSRRGALRASEYAAHPAGLFAFKESVLGLALHVDPGSLAPAATVPVATEGPGASRTGVGLLLVHGDQPGRWFPLRARGESVLGRDADADVPLAYDPFASSRHALLREGPAGWTLTDLRSTNGTRVNLRRVAAGETLPVRPGDLVTIGRSHLLLRDGV